MFGQEAQTQSAPAQPHQVVETSSINASTLGAVIALVEEWLSTHRRTLPPEKKGEIAASIYQIVMEDTAAGAISIDTRKVTQFLRLVA